MQAQRLTGRLEEDLGELLAKAYGQILERAFVVTESFEVFVTTDVFDTIVLAAVVEIYLSQRIASAISPIISLCRFSMSLIGFTYFSRFRNSYLTSSP